MGFRTVWIALKNATPEQVAQPLGLREAPGVDDFAFDTGLYSFTARAWSVVLAAGSEALTWSSRRQAQALSRDGEALFFWQSDGSMCSELLCYRGGREAWGIRHFSTTRASGPLCTGDLPPELQQVLVKQREAQRESDAEHPGLVDHLYEVPADVGFWILGFRHDALDYCEAVTAPRLLSRRAGARPCPDPVVQTVFGCPSEPWPRSAQNDELILAAALKLARERLGADAELEGEVGPSSDGVEVFHFKRVVEHVTEPAMNLTLAEARQLDPDAQPGDALGVPVFLDVVHLGEAISLRLQEEPLL